MTEADRDEKVAQAYRALGAEAPPSALDEAILAAARRRPARWRLPLSVAAVVVLAVGVTLRMLPPRTDAESVALAPTVIETPRPAARPPEQGAQTPPAEAAAARVRESRAARREQGPAAPADVLARKDAPFAGAPMARARDEVQAARPEESPAPSAAANSVRREAVAGAVAQSAERAPAAAAAAPRALAGAKVAAPATPEAWLERIAELKKQGRTREAEESLAEFKKRYPGYKIPEALAR